MIIDKDYFDAEEVDIANAMNDKSRAPIRKIRLATTDSNKYYAKAILVGDQENILSGEIVFRPDSQVSKEGLAFSKVIIKETADVEEYFKNLIRFEGYRIISEKADSENFRAGYDELCMQANKLLFMKSE